jgi:hypothetical protein
VQQRQAGRRAHQLLEARAGAHSLRSEDGRCAAPAPIERPLWQRSVECGHAAAPLTGCIPPYHAAMPSHCCLCALSLLLLPTCAPVAIYSGACTSWRCCAQGSSSSVVRTAAGVQAKRRMMRVYRYLRLSPVQKRRFARVWHAWRRRRRALDVALHGALAALRDALPPAPPPDPCASLPGGPCLPCTSDACDPAAGAATLPPGACARPPEPPEATPTASCARAGLHACTCCTNAPPMATSAQWPEGARVLGACGEATARMEAALAQLVATHRCDEGTLQEHASQAVLPALALSQVRTPVATPPLGPHAA